MENEIQKESLDSGNYSGLALTPTAVNSLNETRKWATFFAILGFIIIGLMVVVLGGILFMSSLLPYPANMVSGPMIAIAFLFIVAINFFPLYFLFQFAAFSKKAIWENSSEYLEKSMNYLRMYYRFLGIVTIVILSIYILIALFAGLLVSFFR